MQTATLSRADIEAHDPEGGRGGRWLCPMPECAEHTDPRRHRSLSLVPETGLWHCHRCHAQGQIKDAWKDFKPKSKKERDADLMARRRVGLEKILAKVATPDADQESAPAPKDRFGSLSRLETSRPALAYLATRGLSSPDALALLTASGVRFAPDFGRREATETVKASSGTASVVFPLRDAKGKLIAAQGRFLKPWSSGQKFHTLGDKLSGVFATHGAMEIMQKGGPVAIVEAPLDAVTLALAGVPALALCGCNGLPEWLQRKACGRHWLIAFDNDENGAGDRAAEKIGEALRTLGGHVQRLKPTEAKDWNEALQIGGEVWDREAGKLKDAVLPIGNILPESETVSAMATIVVNTPQVESQVRPLTPLKDTPELAVQSDPERFRKEKAFELVATGRVSWCWPSTPVRICQGTTADLPQRWVSLAFSRYCDLWRREADPEIAAGSPALHARAARDRLLLLESFMEVLAQGEGGLNSSRID
jgi:hypothetical protein